MISNHISWFEIVYLLYHYTPGFISKESVADLWLIGFIAKAIDSLFINRKDTNSRQIIQAEKIKERQLSFKEGKSQTPLMLFPEGTITSGRHLLQFKRGAFESLLEIKPLMVKFPLNEFSISAGNLDLFMHIFICQCFVYHSFTIYELPIISPTEFMFSNYKGEIKEKK